MLSNNLFSDVIDVLKANPRLVAADDYEVSIQEYRGEATRFNDGRHTQQISKAELWVSLRLVHRRQPGRAAVTMTDRASLQQLVEMAFASARTSVADPWFRFPLWRPFKIKGPKPEAPKEYGSQYEKISALGLPFQEVYETGCRRHAIYRNSDRQTLYDEVPLHAFSARLDLKTELGLLAINDDRRYSVPMDAVDPWVVRLRDRAICRSRSNPHRPVAGEKTILSPSVAARLLRVVAPWFYGPKVLSRQSPLGGHLEERVWSPVINLLNDGNLDGGAWSGQFDSEGCQTQCTQLVRDGVLLDFLFDAYSATKENRLSTGSFLRHKADEVPQVRHADFFIPSSSHSVSSLVADAKEGVFLESLESFEIDPSSHPRFRVSGYGWKISEGRLGAPLHGIEMSGEVQDIFRRAIKVGEDLEFFDGVGSPSILVEKKSI